MSDTAAQPTLYRVGILLRCGACEQEWPCDWKGHLNATEHMRTVHGGTLDDA